MANTNWKNIREAIKNEARLGLGNLLTKTRKSLYEVEKVVLRYPISLARMPEEQAKLIGLYFATTADKLESEIDKLSYFERKFLAEKFPENEETKNGRKDGWANDSFGPVQRLEIAKKQSSLPAYRGAGVSLDDRLSARTTREYRRANSELWERQAAAFGLLPGTHASTLKSGSIPTQLK